ncbi:MAG: hypothetical protein CM15mP23_00630 [Cryomorphaceae bacterium]|nr:MAG: hypothetical protein CM15mP23_00630 [Cryomorphaceae bacterium]
MYKCKFLDFNPLANVDNGDCQTLEYLGCLDTLYQEYNPLYTVNNFEDCINLNIYGCTSPYSQGGLYNPDATVDDGSCVLIGCSDPTYAEYYNQGFIPNQLDPVFNEIFCQTQAVIGCTNQNATNYEASAMLMLNVYLKSIRMLNSIILIMLLPEPATPSYFHIMG